MASLAFFLFQIIGPLYHFMIVSSLSDPRRSQRGRCDHHSGGYQDNCDCCPQGLYCRKLGHRPAHQDYHQRPQTGRAGRKHTVHRGQSTECCRSCWCRSVHCYFVCVPLFFLNSSNLLRNLDFVLFPSLDFSK